MEYKGNKITRKVWNWLDVNEATIKTNKDKDLTKVKDKKLKKQNKNIESINKEIETSFSNIEYGISKDIVELNISELDKYIYLDGSSSNNISDDPDSNVIYSNEYKSGAKKIKIQNANNVLLDIHLKEHIKAIYIIELEKIFNIVTRIKLEKNSNLDLILLDRELNTKESKESIENPKLESVSVIGEQESKANITKIDFGNFDKYFNYTSDLIGNNANINITLTYVLTDKEKYDMSFHQRHIAEQTVGNILVEGILKDESSKIFKGTLDFKKGSKGSIGNEFESITNYSSKTKAISLPILLAAEDEIKGNHAANHGKFDEEQIYYIQSRGFTKEEAENIIAESKIIPILDRVKNKDLKNELKDNLKNILKNK